jgi:hypothetical protein
MAGKIESRRRVRLLCRPPIRAEIEEQREKREKGSKCTKIRRQIRNDYSQSQIAVRVCAGCMYNHPLDECYSRIYCRPVGQHRMVNTVLYLLVSVRKWLVRRRMEEKWTGLLHCTVGIPTVRQCVVIGPAQHQGIKVPRKREKE